MSEKLTRTCAKCGRTLPSWDFPLNGRMASGRDVRCMRCVKEHQEMFESSWMDKYNVKGAVR